MGRPKRGNGEGSIRKRKMPSGHTYYEVSLLLGEDANGKPVRWYGSAHSREEARDKLHDAIEEHRNGRLQAGQRPTLAQFAHSWFISLHKPLAEATLTNYETTYRLHIGPSLGHIRLDRLTSIDVQAFYAAQAKAGKGAATVRRCHAFLRRLLGDARRWHYVKINVADADLVDRPKLPKPQMTCFNAEEAQRFVVALQGDPLEALYLLALVCGLRQGEILALRWADLDWSTGQLLIRHSLTRVQGQLAAKDTKNESSQRGLPLPERVLLALRRHQARQIDQRLAAHPNWQDHDLIFCDDYGQPLIRWTMYKRFFRPLLARAGVPPITFHELRHSTATLLLRLGEQPHVVGQILGHSEISTTLGIYAHVSDSDKRQALARLSHLLGPSDDQK